MNCLNDLICCSLKAKPSKISVKMIIKKVLFVNFLFHGQIQTYTYYIFFSSPSFAKLCIVSGCLSNACQPELVEGGAKKGGLL